jgi:transposase
MSRDKGKTLQKKRSELVEGSFAHVCETGGAKRTWLRGLEKINKRYLFHTAARKLGILMRKLFGIGKPRCLQAGIV